jgi:hypothetical protein
MLTTDGVHMNAEGNKLMATGILRAFGLNEAELQKAEAAWKPLEEQAAAKAKADREAKEANKKN